MPEVTPEEPAGADPVHARFVVLDTNMSGHKGEFDASWVKGLAARLAAQGVQLWVPQVVTWEWADHAAATQAEVLPGLRRLDRLGIPGMPGPPTKTLTRTEIASAIEETLRRMSNVEVVPVHGGSAIQALKDQILLTGPGVRKDGVKTGAADSALVRDSTEHIGRHRVGELAFLSSNKPDIYKTLDTIAGCQDVKVFGNEKALMDGLASSRAERKQEAEQRLENAEVRSAIVKHFRDAEQDLHDSDDGHGVPAESWATRLVAEIDLSGLPSNPGAQFDQVTDVQVHPNSHVAGISGVSVDESETENIRYASFDLILDTVVQVEGYTVDNRDGSIFSGNDEVDALLQIGCVAELRGTEVVNVRQVDRAIVADLDLNFGDETDAQEWLAEYLSELTGTRVQDDPTVGAGGLPARKTLVTAAGQLVASIHFEHPHPDSAAGDGAVWSASFAVGPDEELVIAGGIECLYDSSAEMPLGDGDVIQMFPPYRLSPDGASFIELLAEVADAAVAAELAAVQPETDE